MWTETLFLHRWRNVRVCKHIQVRVDRAKLWKDIFSLSMNYPLYSQWISNFSPKILSVNSIMPGLNQNEIRSKSGLNPYENSASSVWQIYLLAGLDLVIHEVPPLTYFMSNSLLLQDYTQKNGRLGSIRSGGKDHLFLKILSIHFTMLRKGANTDSRGNNDYITHAFFSFLFILIHGATKSAFVWTNKMLQL